MLVCHDCHKTIDAQQDGGRYKADLLIKWKEEQEKRIALVTGVDPSKKSHVVLYGANIGKEKSCLQPEQAKWALFPERYPAEERPICLDMRWEGKDDEPDYWTREETNLCKLFERFVRLPMEEGQHFSIFGFAPVPLLVRLGTLFTDKISAQVFQRQREPEPSWLWSTSAPQAEFIAKAPNETRHPPALVFSLSATISHDRITAVLGPNVSIWELTIPEPHNDFLKSREQLSAFRQTVRKLMVRIAQEHGNQTPLAIFPAMPVAMAVELGRTRMPKADMPWVTYDQNNRVGGFVKALHIGGNHVEH